MKKIITSNFKALSILFILLTIYIIVNAHFYVLNISHNISDRVLRLHIVANSNSDEDQNLKYIVRDNLINYMNSICQSSTSKEETIQLVYTHLDSFEKIANSTIQENGFSYLAHVELGNFEFPTKTYGDIHFPAGFYDAVKVNLGEASGKNWWCVLYPSLCFINNDSCIVSDDAKENLKDTLSNEEYQLISNSDNPTINIKFKLVEFFSRNKILNFTAATNKN